ncbi:DUF2243 domain-containing protein [Paenibacillus thermotolerans]|uniref:DUF2243 domain-containing protein n=1 Tax=Paenibacillus thermotolerans TaxID=3027807 RepID=UPI002368371F|nr:MULTISPECIES: DUF2243 domain-containing protein [unclassified Paenibacillus]
MSAKQKERLFHLGGLILGFGLLGAVDGIVFHQLLQWHSVYMGTHRHGQIVSDGLFHAFTVIALVAGSFVLWKGGLPSGIRNRWAVLWGNILMGGGVFNVVEGIVDHHILQVHHVKQGDPNELLYDLAFLASGFVLFLIGYLVRRSAEGKDFIEVSSRKSRAKAR